MSTSDTTRLSDPTYKAGAVAAKIERLLPVFEAHVAAITGRQGTFNPVTDLDDARLVRDVAWASLKAETVEVEARDPKNGRVYRKTTYPFWVTVGELGGLPPHRFPSEETIRTLVHRCERRVRDLEELPDPVDLIKAVAGAA